MKIKVHLLFLFFFVSIFAYADDVIKGISVTDAWVMAPIPSQTTTAAYMTIINNGMNEAVVKSVSTDVAAVSEIHQMSEGNGMMHMAMLTDLHIPGNAQIVLKPGADHIMLINLKQVLKPGDNVPITLYFQGGGSLLVNAKVRPVQQPSTVSGMAGMKM